MKEVHPEVPKIRKDMGKVLSALDVEEGEAVTAGKDGQGAKPSQR